MFSCEQGEFAGAQSRHKQIPSGPLLTWVWKLSRKTRLGMGVWSTSMEITEPVGADKGAEKSV